MCWRCSRLAIQTVEPQMSKRDTNTLLTGTNSSKRLRDDNSSRHKPERLSPNKILTRSSLTNSGGKSYTNFLTCCHCHFHSTMKVDIINI
jgi:hypothetical protein